MTKLERLLSHAEKKGIQPFSSGGKFQKEIRLHAYPTSVAFTDSGNLLTIVFCTNIELRLFSEEGQFIKDINDKHLKIPQQLSITSDNCLIITDVTDNEIMVLSSVMTYYSPSLPQTVINFQNMLFIILTNSLFLILELIL